MNNLHGTLVEALIGRGSVSRRLGRVAMNRRRELIVNAVWDDQAKVWVATSDDVPGLVTEAPNQGELVKKLKISVLLLKAMQCKMLLFLILQ